MIEVRTLAGGYIGRVSQLGTTRIAETAAMDRAAKLAAATLGYDWAVAWQAYDEPRGSIEVSISDGWNSGKKIARWEFI